MWDGSVFLYADLPTAIGGGGIDYRGILLITLLPS